MKCVLFGGGGFIGTHLCEALLAAGHAVRVLERPRLELDRARHIASQVEWVSGDFCNPVDVSEAIVGAEVVFHLVNTTLPKTSNDNPVYDVESNVVATLRMLEAARHAGVRKVVFLSSGGTVYGIPEQTPIPESHPTNPLCSYGISKLTIEKYLELYRRLHGLDYVALRLANPFGEYQLVHAAQGAVAVFLHNALQGKPIQIWGDGGVIRDYVYVQDVVDALLKVMDYQGSERIFNIGSGRGHSLNELLEIIQSLLGRKLQCQYTAGRALDVPVNILDISRARRCLDWTPKTSLEDGMAKMLRNWRTG